MANPEKKDFTKPDHSIIDIACTDNEMCVCNGEPFDGETIICPNIANFAKILTEELFNNDTDEILTDTPKA